MAEHDGRGLTAAAQAALLNDPEFLRGLVQGAVQAILEAEMTVHLGAERYERAADRTGHRNGYKPRTLHTRVGTLELRVPQDREGTFSTELFARYQRTEQALVVTLMEMYVQGVSTRKVAVITEHLCGTSFSKSQVSALAGRLDADLTAWRERPLTATTYPSLRMDARSEHVRVDGNVVSQGVLIVAGVRDDGRRGTKGTAPNPCLPRSASGGGGKAGRPTTRRRRVVWLRSPPSRQPWPIRLYWRRGTCGNRRCGH